MPLLDTNYLTITDMMMEFKTELLMEEVRAVLQYYAGKRASAKDEYFRYTVCEKDLGMILLLAEEGAMRIDLYLNDLGGGFEISKEEVRFYLKVPEHISPTKENTLTSAIKNLLIRYIVFRWLRLAGNAEILSYDMRSFCEEQINSLRETVTLYYPYRLFTRRLPPF